jgi:hypothetical protein
VKILTMGVGSRRMDTSPALWREFCAVLVGAMESVCKYTWKGVSLNILLRSYSRGIGSKGLRPQLVCCAPFLSIAPYFRLLYLSYLKIWMAMVAYPKVRMTFIWYPDVETSILFLSEDKE